ncbi:MULTISPECIES: hypothetical protein [unclassified Nocardioides]|uniref:hypothetical protein n=1 Tax=unclassified Nocardioides TaxID=2615069 RepID=UPI0002F39E21|nr:MULTISPECIES: hypothetical protein [unclassified Nocardioides]
MQLDVAGGGACQALHGRGEPEELLDRVGDQPRVVEQQPALVARGLEQLHGPPEHAGGGVVAAGHDGEDVGEDREQAAGVVADARRDQVRDRVVARLAAAPVDQLGEVRHQLAERLGGTEHLTGRARRDDRVGPGGEPLAPVLGHPQVVRDHHRRQRFEQRLDHVAPALCTQPLEALDDERAHHRLERRDLARREAARDQLAERGVLRRVQHHQRAVVGQVRRGSEANELQSVTRGPRRPDRPIHPARAPPRVLVADVIVDLHEGDDGMDGDGVHAGTLRSFIGVGRRTRSRHVRG